MTAARTWGVLAWGWLVLVGTCLPLRAQAVESAPQRFAQIDIAVQRATPLRPQLHPDAYARVVGMVLVGQSAGVRPIHEVEPALRWMVDELDDRVTLGRDSRRFADLLGTLMLAWGVTEQDPDVLVRRYVRMLEVVRQQQPTWSAEGEDAQWAAASLTLAASLRISDEKTAVSHYRAASTHRLRPALTRPRSQAYARGPLYWTLAACLRQVSIEQVAQSWMELRHGMEQRLVGDTSTVPFEEAVNALMMAWTFSNGNEKTVLAAHDLSMTTVARMQLTPWSEPFIRGSSLLTTAMMVRRDSQIMAAQYQSMDQFLQGQGLRLPPTSESYQTLLGLLTLAQALVGPAAR